MATPTKQNVGATIKLYLFPSLISILSIMIWRDISELRSDVKSLLAQSNVDKTKIENLEKDVRSLENAVFHKRVASTNRWKTMDYHISVDKLFKHEEFFDIEKNIITEEA